jgi:soluble lytic murein transglycosylase
LIRAYKGNIPFALAAYNAGTGRLRRWLAQRSDLGDIENNPSSDPEAEIWVDELPWEETTKYVKSILRNYMIYNALEKGEFSLSNPIWKAGEKAASK